MDDSTLRCAECNAAVMELDWNPDSWAAGEINDLKEEVDDLSMQLDLAEFDRDHQERKTNALMQARESYRAKCKADAQEDNNKLAFKCVTYSNIIDTLKHIVKYGQKPGADATIKLNLLLKEGGYPPI